VNVKGCFSRAAENAEKKRCAPDAAG